MIVRALGPDGVLALVAVATLAIVARALGGELRIPWDGVLPFLGVAGALLAIATVTNLASRLPVDLVRSVRLWAPFAVAYLCYRALRGALPVLVDHGVEASLVRGDELLLGSSPAWSLSVIHAPWLTELLAYAYAMMFFLPLAVLLALHVRRRDRELREVAISLQLAFYVGFALFLLVPARSPDVVYAFAPLEGGPFYEMSMRAWRSLQAVTYDAFPSMHTTISTIALVQAIRMRARFWPAMVPIVALLQLATLYLRQHYFVDVLAGWGVAALAVSSAAWLVASHSPRSVPTALQSQTA